MLTPRPGKHRETAPTADQLLVAFAATAMVPVALWVVSQPELGVGMFGTVGAAGYVARRRRR